MTTLDDALAAIATDPGALFEPGPLEALKDLRSENPAKFARVRADAKASKAVSMSEFDRLTAPRAPGDAGSEMFPEVDPWGDPVDGGDLLNEIVATFQCHVVADPATIHAAALWVVHTWMLDAATVSPIANIAAPEMRCGKSVFLTALGKLAYRPMQVANIAPAALFRAIEAWSPTLLIDEVDTFLAEHDEARGIINSGFTRDSAFVIRCVGDDHMPTKFATWGAKALCGIGKIADTLADRSIPLRLRRKTPQETVTNIRHSDPAIWEALRSKIARWADDHMGEVRRLRPTTIEGLNDRANDCWEPLLAIADTIAGEWPKRARSAAAILHGLDADAPSIGAQLLADIREAFGTKARMFTVELLAALVADEESPWPTWNRGRPMSARQLSGRLAEFGIRPGTVRNGLTTAKGYALAQFSDAFTRYLPADTAVSSVTSSQPRRGAGFEEFPSVTRSPVVTDHETLKRSCGAGCVGVTVETGNWPEEGAGVTL